MADIELVIKISEEKLSMIKNKMYCGIYDAELYKAIENGIKLPKGHGRIIDESKIMIGINNAPTIIKAESEVKQVDDNEFETLAMMIENLETVEEIAYKKYEHYFDTKNHDKAHIFMALSNRINLEIQMLEIYMDMEDK